MSSCRGASTNLPPLDVMYIIRFHYLGLQYMMHFAMTIFQPHNMQNLTPNPTNTEASRGITSTYKTPTDFACRITWKSKIRRMSCKKSLKRRQPLNSWQASRMNDQPSKRHPKSCNFSYGPICCGVVRLLEPKFLCFRYSSCGLCWYITLTSPTSPTLKGVRNNHIVPLILHQTYWHEVKPNKIFISFTQFCFCCSSFHIFQHLENFEIHTLPASSFGVVVVRLFLAPVMGTPSPLGEPSPIGNDRILKLSGGFFWNFDVCFSKLCGSSQFDWKWIMNSKWCVFSNGFLEAFVLGGLVHDPRYFNTFQRFFNIFQDIHIHINFNSTDHHNQT